jgi:hypothetical protein
MVTILVLLTTACLFKLSHCIFRPLRIFNRRMIDIMVEGMKKDLEPATESSCELTKLYEVFS